VQGTEEWWEKHIAATAAHLEKRGIKRVMVLLKNTRGWSGKTLDSKPFQAAGRALAGTVVRKKLKSPIFSEN